jgi:hypothetical protein
MLKKIAVATLALLMLAGCAGQPGSAESNRIMAKAGDVQIPYGEYRAYLDTVGELYRQNALRNVAFSAALEKDLADSGDISREEFEAQYTYQVMYMLQEETYAQNAERIRQTLGLDEAQLSALLLELYWPDYLASVLSGQFEKQAAEQEGTDAETLWSAYEEELAARIDYDFPNALFGLDAEAAQVTESQRHAMDYSAMTARIDEISSIALFIRLNEELTAKGMTVDYSEYDDYFQTNLASIMEDTDTADMIARSIKAQGITQEAFEASFKAYMKLQYAVSDMLEFLSAEYETLEDEQKPVTAEDYANEYAQKIVESIEVVDLA